ncbi:MAG TPA: DUF1549 and DUF1553 domain-containing protein [Pirellulales bacterium]|nr:DUF1549 and DUF1553 domain-containing protein [Pirellulales bacterium]
MWRTNSDQRVSSPAHSPPVVIFDIFRRRVSPLGVVAVFATLLVGCELLADDAATTANKKTSTADAWSATTSALYPAGQSSATDAEAISAEQMAAHIDRLLADAWQAAGVEAASPTTDSEFVRRVYLDLIGRIPSVAETLDFVDDTHADKRRLLVENLLQRGAWAAHFANTWRDLLLAGSANPEMRAQSAALESWLRLRFAVNMPYDKMARELLTARVSSGATDAGEPSPAAFYLAADYKPEQLAASTSRVFLGIQLQCAQCHDHPFASWKREQFWQMAAFFKDLNNETAMPAEKPLTLAALVKLVSLDDADSLKVPDSKIVVKPQFLDGKSPQFKPDQIKREVLAQWIVDSANPLFARAAVNRLWDHFFGRGLVSPVDHLDTAGPPSQPQVFDELSQQFVLHGYDLKYLIRVITATQAYQLSSAAGGKPNDQQLLLFGRMPLRRMSGDQLFASFVQATGFQPVSQSTTQAAQLEPTARDDFQARFNDNSVPRTEAPTTILQALALMNGKYVADATDLKESRVFASIADAPYLDAKGRIEMLFLSALSRRPDATELEQLSAYISSSPKHDEKGPLADVFWSLLNSAEFVLNH